MSGEPLAIGLDVGGTKVLGGVVAPDGTILARARTATPHGDAEFTTDALTDMVEELRREHPGVAAVGIGAAGWIAADNASVLFAPHLNWRGGGVRDALAGRTGLPVLLDNDANTAAWAEHRFGAGRGQDHLVMITVGTGIGAGIVLGGQLYRGAFGVAGEPGHMQVVPDGRPCQCGNFGCWEQYASGRALVYEARLHRPNGELTDEIVDGVTGPAVTAAAQAGEPAAVAAFTRVGHWLGLGLASLAAVLDPGMFVLGGGVSEAGDLLLVPAREEYHAKLAGRGDRPFAAVELATLGPDAGLVGAADLARRLAY